MELQLQKGKAYLVKHSSSKRMVRRIFKGTEKRFGEITCFVFTGQVKVSTSVILEYGKNYDHQKNEGVTFWHWKGIKHPPSEISIPFYNLKEVTPI